MANFITGCFVGAAFAFVVCCVTSWSSKMTEEEAERFYVNKRDARLRALLNGARDFR